MPECDIISCKAMNILSVTYEKHQAVLWAMRFMINVVIVRNLTESSASTVYDEY